MVDKENDKIAKEPVAEYFTLNQQYTYWDYIKWTFAERVELIRGRVVPMAPAPSEKHQRVSGDLYYQFASQLSQPQCRIYCAPFDVVLPVPTGVKDSTVVQPDIVVVCNPAILDAQGCKGSPDLVVEIISPGNANHDLVVKYKLYEESGVKEFWVVQPSEKLILVYTLKNGQYQSLPPFGPDMTIQSPLFPFLNIEVNRVFENMLP